MRRNQINSHIVVGLFAGFEGFDADGTMVVVDVRSYSELGVVLDLFKKQKFN